MSFVKWAFFGLILLPVAEIGVFLLVAFTIGWLWAVALFLFTSVVGVLILKRTGRGNLDRFAGAFGQEGIRAIHLETPGVTTMVGGILLVIPGFITDAVGLVLLVAPLRRWAGARFRQALRGRRDARDRSVVDLTPDEWRQVSERTLEDGRHGEPRDP